MLSNSGYLHSETNIQVVLPALQGLDKRYYEVVGFGIELVALTKDFVLQFLNVTYTSFKSIKVPRINKALARSPVEIQLCATGSRTPNQFLSKKVILHQTC